MELDTLKSNLKFEKSYFYCYQVLNFRVYNKKVRKKFTDIRTFF